MRNTGNQVACPEVIAFRFVQKKQETPRQSAGISSREELLLRLILPPISPLPASGTCHRTSFGNVIALPATQGPAAEVPAGCRTPVIDSTTPLPDPAVVRRLFTQVPARCIGKEKAIRFQKTAFAEVLQLVGFALPDENNGEPAAALSASAAGAGCRGRSGGFHGVITVPRLNGPVC
jgi:hypothetical protein